MLKKWVGALLALFTLLTLLPGQAGAADLLIPNYSFETGTIAHWNQNYGTGGITVVSDKAHTGSYSVKIVDTINGQQFGLQGGYMPATAGKSYYAYAWAYIESGAADLYLRFYNSSYTLLTSTFVNKSTPQNQWFSMQTGGVAPAGTAYVAVLLYSNNVNVGTVYWDDVMVTADLTTVGTTVTSAAMRSATLGNDANGKPAFYIGLNGSSDVNAKMVEVNVNTGAVQRQMPMAGTTYAHAAATTVDNKIYMGTYPNGYLFKYTPGDAAPVNLGRAISDATYILALSPSDIAGKVYGGTYPNSGVFKYENSPGFYTFVPKPFFAGSQYTYSIVHDAANNVLYAGTGGTVAQISRLENAGGQRNDNLVPAVLANANTAVDKLSYSGGKVFGRLIPSNTEIVLDVTDNPNGTVTVVMDASFPITSYGVSPALNGKVYFSDNGLKTYDIATKTVAAALNPDNSPHFPAANGYGWGIATLDDQVNFPGQSIVAVGHSSGQIMLFRYNPTTKKSSNVLLTGITGVAADIGLVGSGPDGKIYTSGFLSGNMGVYTPMRSDQNAMLYGIGQLEGMTYQGNTMFLGAYPDANIYKYDLSNGWANKTKILDLGTSNLQERPYGMAQGDGKVFIGTVAASGHLQGALTVYDVATNTAQVYYNIVPNQSIVSVAYLNGYVYAGSTIGGGKNTTPVATEAKLVKLNVATGAYTTYTMPVSSQGITALTVGPDNKIWGLSEGYLFVFNPATNTVEYHVQKFTDVSYTSTTQITRDGSLVMGRPGSNKMFGTIKTRFFSIDTTTKAVTTHFTASTAVNSASLDYYGNVYFSNGNDLYRWAY
ncbi:hypothetical protein [Paenibacillus koleovorans]|uniref:hypothetical protein n=1 Tax=Paenibacillus koleovorans TaxID=121608 RepID=UPI000FD7F9E6|nr:hypothetical protein [Paenibacillus koleovorans]